MAETKTSSDLEEELLSITSIFDEIKVTSTPQGQTVLVYGHLPNTITLTINTGTYLYYTKLMNTNSITVL